MKNGAMIDVGNNVCVIRCCLTPFSRDKTEDSTDGPSRLSLGQRLVRCWMRCLGKRREEHQEREVYSLT